MTTAGSLLGRRCVVVGGAGAVGGMFVGLLLGAGASVCVVDTAAEPDGGASRGAYLRGDVAAPDARLLHELHRAEIVVLAVPEDIALAAVERVAGALAPGGLLVDTLSVKGPFVAAVRAHAANIEAVSLNPMFAPALGMAGRAVAAVVVHDGPRAQELLELIAHWGGRVAECSADEHDARAAATQALTHAAVLAFGLALAELGADVSELAAVAPPPHTTLLALLARIVSGAPETYWDVQAANPHADRARAALANGMRRLADVVDGGEVEDFAAVLDELRGVLGDDVDDLRDTCEQLFRTTHRSPADRRGVVTSPNNEKVNP